MDTIKRIQIKYNKILNHYSKNYNPNNDKFLTDKFKEFHILFITMIPKEVNNENVIIDKRDELDILREILVTIAGNQHKSKAYYLQERLEYLFRHRDKFIETIKQRNLRFPKKITKNQLTIKPDFGLLLIKN